MCEHGHFWTEQMAGRELTSQQYRQSKSLNSSRTLRRRGILPSKTTLESASHHSSLWSSCSSECEGTRLVTALWTSFTGVMKHQLLLCYCNKRELRCWGDHGLTLLLGDCLYNSCPSNKQPGFLGRVPQLLTLLVSATSTRPSPCLEQQVAPCSLGDTKSPATLWSFLLAALEHLCTATSACV